MNWRPSLILLHVVSDAFIVLAYATIPVLLLKVVRRRKDISFSWMLLAFGAFILACGATHLISIVTLWKPWYLEEGLLKLGTAIASVATAVLLRRLVPVLLAMPSAKQLQEANEALARSHAELETRSNELAESYAALEVNSEAHKKTEEQFRQLANSMPHIVWTADGAGHVDYYNDRWYAYTGFAPKAIGDPSWLGLLHQEDTEKRFSPAHPSVREGVPFRVEYRLWDLASGRYRWHLGQALPIRNEEGAIVKWYGACTDIDDYKKAQIEVSSLNAQLETRVAERTQELTRRNEELRQSQTRWQAILQSATDVSIMALDNQGVITFFNSGTERLLGYRAEEVVGKCTPAMLYPPEERELRAQRLSAQLKRPVKVEEIFLAVNQPNHSFISESVYLHRDGTRIDVSLATSPMIDSEGERLGKLAIAVDMRPRKALEQELTQKNVHLQEQTGRAEEANRAKSAFLSAMSHEIRTPMNAILGMADLLWESELSETQRKYVSVFKRACATLLSLVNDILDLSKIESGHFKLEQIDFDLRDVIDLAMDIIRPKTEAKAILLKSTLTPNIPSTLIGDPTRLQQILVNLLGNAAKFTEKGAITLSIEALPGEPGHLQFAVSDTGIGIPADKLELIFKDFEQAESSTTRRFGGTGLGLGICRRLVSRMGGELRVKSELGQGSCFYFDAVFGVGLPEERPRSEQLIESLRNRRVLIVDDNKINRLIFVEICRAWGMTTSELDDFPKCLSLLESGGMANDYDLVIIDRMIHGNDGLELAAIIRKCYPRLPILLITSDNIPGDQTKVLNLGAAEYAVKPVRRPDLLRLACKLLSAAPTPPANVPLKTEKAVSVANAHGERKMQILIAEDSEDNQFLLQEYLKAEPFEITMVENGKAAVEAARTKAFDLILMDTQMPVMDGLTATKEIREQEKRSGRPPVPLLALTANARPEDVENSREAGSDAHISKPIAREDLIKAIRHYTGPAGQLGGALRTRIEAPVFAKAEELVSSNA